jgi:nucleoside-diphosphate-sugar epimerase
VRVLVTGGSGFVGRLLCEDLLARGHLVRAPVRSPEAAARLPEGVEPASIAPLGPDTDWAPALRGMDAVVHSAGLAHVLRGAPPEAYERANTQGTERLAQQAAAAGVRRLVFLSTVKVHGDGSGPRPLEATDPFRPGDAYAASKVGAEEALMSGRLTPSLSVDIVRPPLVYGPGVRANFLRMMTMVSRGLPLPLGSIHNRRSFVSVWNLCDLVATLLSSAREGRRAWLVSDGEDVSTPALLALIGEAMGRPARVFPLPLPLLRALFLAAGMGAEYSRLTGSLCLGIDPVRRELGWSPPLTLAQGLERTVRASRVEALAR